MPTPSNVQLQIVKNGGSAVTGAITAAFSDSIVLKLADASGVKKAKYRIREFPDGFVLPAGWTQEAANTYSVTVANGAAAPAFALPTSGNELRGKYFFDVEVNDRRRNGAIANDLYASAALQIPFLTSGLTDVGFLESNEFDQVRQWVGGIKALVRKLDVAVFSGGGVTDHGALSGLGDDDHAQYQRTDGTRALTGDQDAGGHKITGLGPPELAADAATKDYVDSTAGFLPIGTPSPGFVVKWDGTEAIWASATAYSITAFAVTVPLREVGDTAASPAFTASHSASPVTLTLTNTDNSESKDVHATPASFTSSLSYTKSTNNASVTFTITGSDGISGANRSASIFWRPRVYWGTGAHGINTAAGILALASSALQASRVGSFTVNATGSLKIYWAAPASYGTPVFTVGGFSGGYSLVSATISVTNAFGITQLHQLWESDTAGLGNTTTGVS